MFSSSLRKFHPLRVAASAGLKGALPKVLVGAALLGGGGFVLSAGSAQAATTTCGAGGSLTAGDKIVSGIVCSDDLPLDTPITFDELLGGLIYDFGGGDIDGGSLAGSISYAIEIFTGGQVFETVQLDSECASTGGTCTVEKDVLTAIDGTNVIPTLTSLNGANSGRFALPGDLTSLYIVDSWTTTPTAAVVAVDNNFTQVPAPLPLLGIAAAFGSIRKMRKFSSQLKTFSMG